MVKKLTDEEIEEYKHDNYQMMAAVSGKSLSELMGETPDRSNFNSNYCLIKQMYLKACVEPISSKQLYLTLKRQGYKAKNSTFRGLLNYYLTNKYIRKTNDKKPFLYVLTDEGKIHAKHPYVAVDENRKRYKTFLYDKLGEIIKDDQDQFKAIYESIFGAQQNNIIGSAGIINNSPQYSDHDIGSKEDAEKEINSQIYDKTFFKDVNDDKLKSLLNMIKNSPLSDDEKEKMVIDALMEAANTNKGGMTLVTTQYQSRPQGERKYYAVLVSAINHKVTKGLYESMPFKFIIMDTTGELRLEADPFAGKSRNDGDSKIANFDYVNHKYFDNSMMIRTKPNEEKQELEFYYVGTKINYKITTMSYNDYTKAKSKAGKPNLKINFTPL